MHKVHMWFSLKFCDNTRLFCDFRYLKINCRTIVFYKKGILKIFAKFTRKHLCWTLFLTCDYRDSSTGVFLCIFKNFFVEHLGTVASETLHD